MRTALGTAPTRSKPQTPPTAPDPGGPTNAIMGCAHGLPAVHPAPLGPACRAPGVAVAPATPAPVTPCTEGPWHHQCSALCHGQPRTSRHRRAMHPYRTPASPTLASSPSPLSSTPSPLPQALLPPPTPYPSLPHPRPPALCPPGGSPTPASSMPSNLCLLPHSSHPAPCLLQQRCAPEWTHMGWLGGTHLLQQCPSQTPEGAGRELLSSRAGSFSSRAGSFSLRGGSFRGDP